MSQNYNIKKQITIPGNKTTGEKLSRKEWLGKAGKYSVFTTATMMMILNPGEVAAQDSGPADPPLWP